MRWTRRFDSPIPEALKRLPVGGLLACFVSRGLWREMRLCSRWQDRFALWFCPPGSRPADVLARHGAHRFDIRAVQAFDPPLSRARQWAAFILFLLLLAATSALLWNAHLLSTPAVAAGAGAIVAGLWAVGSLCTPRAAAPVPAGA